MSTLLQADGRVNDESLGAADAEVRMQEGDTQLDGGTRSCEPSNDDAKTSQQQRQERQR